MSPLSLLSPLTSLTLLSINLLPFTVHRLAILHGYSIGDYRLSIHSVFTNFVVSAIKSLTQNINFLGFLSYETDIRSLTLVKYFTRCLFIFCFFKNHHYSGTYQMLSFWEFREVQYLTNFRKDRTWKLSKFVATPVTNLVKKPLVPCKRSQKMPSPNRISVRTYQIKSNPLVINHKYRASGPVKKVFH